MQDGSLPHNGERKGKLNTKEAEIPHEPRTLVSGMGSRNAPGLPLTDVRGSWFVPISLNLNEPVFKLAISFFKNKVTLLSSRK